MISEHSPITLGQRIDTFETNGFVLTEGRYDAFTELPRHGHHNAAISFALRGSFTEFVDRDPFDCDVHSVLLKPPGEMHSNVYGRQGARCLFIEVKPERLALIRSLARIFERTLRLEGAHPRALATRIYDEFSARDAATGLAIEGLIFELLGEACRTEMNQGRPRWLIHARNYLDEHFAENVGLMNLAELVGAHPTSLARAFRRFFGCSVGEYVRERRIDLAIRRLTESDAPLQEIALSAGFYDQSHFSNEFRRRVGVTPKRFRAGSGLKR